MYKQGDLITLRERLDNPTQYEETTYNLAYTFPNLGIDGATATRLWNDMTAMLNAMPETPLFPRETYIRLRRAQIKRRAKCRPAEYVTT